MILAESLPAASTLPSLHERYRSAAPFPHLILDQFLPDHLVRDILLSFPPFSEEHAISENGQYAGKMVISCLPELGEPFRKLNSFLSSPELLAFLSSVTGIPNLIFDPAYFGAGVHSSLPCQKLDAHIDFNVHPHKNWHRRINLLVYLNPNWESTHGGSLELHSDPRNSQSNFIQKIAPLANRCVIFETNEKSWHGHEEILGPPGSTRKSIAAFYYTDVSEHLDPPLPHMTIYADPPLTGDETHAELTTLLQRRASHLSRLFRNERELLLMLEKLNGKCNAISLEAAPKSSEPDLRQMIECIDAHVIRAYEREKSLQQLIDELNADVSSLDFLFSDLHSDQML